MRGMQSAETPAPTPSTVHPATALLREILELTDAFEKSLEAHLSVNATDREAMQHLIASGPLAASDLGRRLGVSSATTTTVIDRLSALGHVRREPNPRDRRGVIVVPSAASTAKAMAVIVPMIVEVDATLDDFTATDREAITRYLQNVVSVYRRHAEPVSAPPSASRSVSASA